MIDVVVNESVHVKGNGEDFMQLMRTMEQELTWSNPDYDKKQRIGKWTGNTPKFLTLVERFGRNEFAIPFGMARRIFDMCRLDPDFAIKSSSHLTHFEPVFSPIDVGCMNLYPYQEKAVKTAINAKNGVIVAPCGSGKTQMGLAICGALGMRCLWLTHTHELLKQSMDRALSFLPISKGDVGTITGGKVNCGEFITFATVQTMAKISLTRLHEFFDVIIVDECHKAVGTPTKMTMFWSVISKLSARYKFGLTATPKRADGMECAMFALLGDAVIVDRSEVKSTTCPLEVSKIFTGWKPSADAFNPDGTLNYNGLVNSCCRDDARNTLIAENIFGMNGAVMVLSERIEHLKLLSEKCGAAKRCAILSTASKRERGDAIERMKNGDLDVLFATYQLAKEGLDIPNMRHLVMASPVKDEITVTQSAGRVMRKSEGKSCGIVWDVVDDMRMLIGWHNKRMRIYRRLQNEC